MQRVITISLNGNAYQLDEAAYQVLHLYLTDAEHGLGHDPDRIEILRDLEQAIAEKLAQFLGPGKSVVVTAEVEQVLRDVGPVSFEASQGAAAGSAPPRRLYQIREGAIFSGVCNGVAAYFSVDPTMVRLAAAIAAVLEMSWGDRPPVLVVGAYVLLMFIVPYAKTPDELAAAQGVSTGVPYKVQRFVERVKRAIGRRWSGGSRSAASHQRN